MCFPCCDVWEGESCFWVAAVDRDIFCTDSLLEESFYQELRFGIGSGVYPITIFEWRGWEGPFCPVPFDRFENVLAVREVIQLCTPVVSLCLAYCAAEILLCCFYLSWGAIWVS